MTNEVDETSARTDRAIRLIQKLLAKAEDPACPPGEKQALELKIADLVKQYRIDEQNLIAKDQFAITPVRRDMNMCPYFWNDSPLTFDFTGYYHWMLLDVAKAAGIRFKLVLESVEGRYHHVAKMVGYDSDLRYAELIWMNIRLTFISNVDVRVDRNLSDEENIYRLRRAGVVRKDIAEALWGSWNHSNSAKVARIYEAECRKRGEDPLVSGRGVSKKVFREAFAREFANRVNERLRRLSDGSMGTAGTLDISGREKKVEEAFYEAFPEERPKPVHLTVNTNGSESKAKNKLAKQKGPTKAEMREWERKYYSPAAKAGAKLGTDAADSVVFTRTAEKTDRLPSNSATPPTGGSLPAVGG